MSSLQIALRIIEQAVPILVGVLGAVIPILRAQAGKDRAAADQAKLHAATKAAYLVMAEVAKRTNTKIDDAIPPLLRMVEQEFFVARGRRLTEAERLEAEAKAVTMSVDPSQPGSLGELTDSQVAALVPFYAPPQAKQRVAP